MAHQLQIVKTSDFVRLDAQGKFDFEETKHALESIAATCIKRDINEALLDVRELQANFELSDLYRLAQAFKEMGFQQSHRLAILHRFTGGKGADFFALCAQERGWNVSAFDDYEKAIEWLGTQSMKAP